MYSIFCAFAVLFVVTVVPETKGRNLEDIAKMFTKTGSDSTLDAKAKLDGVKCEHCGTMVATIKNGKMGTIANESETTKL